MKPLDENLARAITAAAFDAVAAADVRVNIDARETGFLRWANNEVTTSGQITDASVAVTVAVGSKHATVAVHGLRAGDVAAATKRALELAKLAPDDPEYVPSPGASTMKPVASAWSDAPVGADGRAALAADAIAVAKKSQLGGFGYVEDERTSEWVATRAGFAGLHHATGLYLTTTARTPDGGGSGWACGSAVAARDVDAGALARIAADKALRSQKPRALDPGVYPVVLEPAAVAGLMRWMSLETRAADEGRSAFSKPGGGTRVGEKLFGLTTVRSDPWSPLVPSAPFDEEGLPRPPVTWVKDGVLEKLRTSRYWAKKTGRPADAHYDKLAPMGPRAEPLESLVAGLERGLVITRLWYIRMLEPQTLTVTGLTRDGVFLVENGKLTAPVNNFRFNQSVVQMLADSEAWTAPVRVPGEQGEILAAPAVRCRAFHLSSKSDAV